MIHLRTCFLLCLPSGLLIVLMPCKSLSSSWYRQMNEADSRCQQRVSIHCEARSRNYTLFRNQFATARPRKNLLQSL
ncbi:hypothetical protein BD769DRAFT_45401 [Suillus cothurnatus]|nr:hypothetical protein BD769DRAFT_45401 [Suillus cothurnatus]